MFKDYVYRSPDTSDDINAVNLILSLIKDKNIKTISEVGGNNGVFEKNFIKSIEY